MFPVPKEGVGPHRSFVNVPPSATPSHYLFNPNPFALLHFAIKGKFADAPFDRLQKAVGVFPCL